MGTMDGIIDTVSANHPLLPLLSLLKTHGKLVMVGLPEKPLELPVFPLVGGKHITDNIIDYGPLHHDFLCFPNGRRGCNCDLSYTSPI